MFFYFCRMNYFEISAFIVLAYLIGSIPTAVWIGKIFSGIDVREYGSKNAGATNTVRVLGLKAGIPVLVIDILKGWCSLKLAYLIINLIPYTEAFYNIQILLGIAAVLGHVFPLFARFRGGKGIATLVGVTIALFPYPILVIFALFIIIFLLTEYVSLGSIICGLAFPFIVVFVFSYDVPSMVIFSFSIAVLIPITHQKNIKRLLKGQEAKLKLKNRKKNI